MNKRTFLKNGLAFGAGIIVAPGIAGNSLTGKIKDPSSPAFDQIKLPYAYNALEPYIDAATMELHYSKHHAGYAANFKKALESDGLTSKSLKEIFGSVSKHSAAIRNHGGGTFNHNLFWQVMKPGGGGEPKGALKTAIDSSFGSFSAFREQFSARASTVFGSGWAWLIVQDGKLKITSTPNQDNPLMDVAQDRGIPILGLDVWEHAYYLKYQNRRADYINAFWSVVNWDHVAGLQKM
jgi:superoxide dismutase, Fe-Mn family